MPDPKDPNAPIEAEKSVEAIDAVTDAQKRNTEAADDAAKASETLRKLEVERAVAETKLAASLQEVNDQVARRSQAEKDFNKIQTENAAGLSDLNQLLRAKLNNDKVAIKALGQQSKAVQELNKGQAEGVELTEAQIVAEIKRRKVLDRSTAAQEAFSDSVVSTGRGLLQTTLGIGQYDGSLKKLGNMLADADTAGGGFSLSLGKVFNATNLSNLAFDVASSTINKFVEATVMAVKTSQDLLGTMGSEMGMMEDIDDITALMDMANESDIASASLANVGSNLVTLQIETQGLFGNLLKTNPKLGLFSEEMKKLGVSASTTGKFFFSLGKTLGIKNVEEIKKQQRAVVELARSFGESSDKIVLDVAKITDSYGDMGKGAEEAAKRIEKIGLSTKVSTDKIVGFTEKFALIDNAVKTATDLNMVFGKVVVSGTELNQMFYSGGRDQIYNKMLGEMINNFDELNANTGAAIAKRRQLAKAMGLTNAEMRDTMSAIREAGGAEATMASVTEKTQEAAMAADKYALIQDQIMKLQQQFAIAIAPVVKLLGGLIGWFNEAAESMGPVFKVIVGGTFIIGGFVAGLMLLKKSVIDAPSALIRMAGSMDHLAISTEKAAMAQAELLMLQRQSQGIPHAPGQMGFIGPVQQPGGAGSGRVGSVMPAVTGKGLTAAKWGGGLMMGAMGIASSVNALKAAQTEKGMSTGQKVGLGVALLGAIAAGFFTGGTGWAMIPAIMSGYGAGSMIGQGIGGMFDDFVYAETPTSGGRKVATAVNPDDEFFAAKPGGAIASNAAFAGGGGPTEQVVTLNIPDLGIQNLKLKLNEANQFDREITMAAGLG